MRGRHPEHSRRTAPLASLPILGALLACAAFGNEQTPDEAPSDGPEARSQEEALELYSSPYVTDSKKPTYPRLALQKNKEGWVRLDFMVDTNGRPYEIAVTESVGDEAFQKAAVRALEKSKFEPAQFHGEPLDAGHYQYYHFQMDSAGASGWFVARYRRLMEAVGDGNRDEADRLLDELESSDARNLYEDAYLHVAKSGYYATWGDEQQQLEALDRAVGHHTAEKRLPESVYASLQHARFLLLVKTQDFGRARQVFETLTEFPLGEGILAQLQSIADRLEALHVDDRGYTVPGDFGEDFSWNYHLFKDEFFFDDVEGEIEEIKLRCARKYVFLRFDPHLQYTIKQDYMPCRLQLIGSPGTTFTLTQL